MTPPPLGRSEEGYFQKSSNPQPVLRRRNSTDSGKCQKTLIGYPKNGTSGAQNKNLTPDLESVTKTDSETGFRFEF